MTVPLEIEIDAGPEAAAEAIAVMHAAFAEYAATGLASGAMTETRDTLLEEMAAGTAVAIARVDGRAVASAKHHPAEDGSLYFGRLGVASEARGRGIAAAMVRALRAHAHAQGRPGLSCLVRASESGNIAIYQGLGMEITGSGERVSRTGALISVVEMADAATPQG
ncbi:GNAT family N-acetyltransferase [Demequina silvatica]|uniref:GNAT family N-acetyltransferase n=1 Tax=Demequina silvatica TaxID=1638988 RepID=UPI000785AE20|nr:GNAT family N-acetyltransferase [Demequina silvatica]